MINRGRAFKKGEELKVVWYVLGLLGFAILNTFVCIAIATRDFFIIKTLYPTESLIALVVFGVLLVVFVYQTDVVRGTYKSYSRLREYFIVNISITLTAVLSAAMYSFVSPYAMPIAAASFLVAILLSQRIGILVGVANFMISLVTCPLVTYNIEHYISVGQVSGIFVGLISAICMTFLVHRGYTRLKITIGGIIVGFAMFPFGIPLGIIEGFDVVGVIRTCFACFLGNAVAVGFATLILPLFETIFRIWTDFKLAEVCSLNQPLLRELKEKAPGTFSHSLTVATLAENCAIALGLNPFMARACAMYHDIGKINNPEFFVENQQGGYNPHDDLIIDVSVKMITEHPEAGAKILRENKLPDTVIKAALEHHGDSTLMFFYLKAKGLTEGDLEADKYRYSNPKPSTKYSAIIMICDMCEATIRARKPATQEELDNIVYKIIEGRILDGQLSECNISILELQKIKTSISQAMPSMLHERIDYDKAKERR